MQHENITRWWVRMMTSAWVTEPYRSAHMFQVSKGCLNQYVHKYIYIFLNQWSTIKQVVVILKFQPNELSTQKSKKMSPSTPLLLETSVAWLAVPSGTLSGFWDTRRTPSYTAWDGSGWMGRVVLLDENHFDLLDIISGRVNQNWNRTAIRT